MVATNSPMLMPGQTWQPAIESAAVHTGAMHRVMTASLTAVAMGSLILMPAQTWQLAVENESTTAMATLRWSRRKRNMALEISTKALA
jgi:hypothetical protein